MLAISLPAVLAACGAAPARSSTATASAAATPPPATVAATSNAASFELTSDELPTGSFGQLTQMSDESLPNQANSDARVFSGSAGAITLEIDVLPDTSATQAQNDYPAVRDTARKHMTVVSSSSTPDIGDQSDEFIGAAADGSSIVAVSFEQGSVLCAVIMRTPSGNVYQTYVESVAAAQSQKISTST